MRAVIQRVSQASVSVDGKTVGEIGFGMLLLLGVSGSDDEKAADKLAEKVVNLRFYNDEGGKMNLSTLDVKGDILVISQFTLYGDCKKGRRPSYTDAAAPEKAESLYNYFVSRLRQYNLKIESGIFGAMMSVSLINEGPVTLIVDV